MLCYNDNYSANKLAMDQICISLLLLAMYTMCFLFLSRLTMSKFYHQKSDFVNSKGNYENNIPRNK